ncbi:MAG: beta-propeller fold lactonase family protein [Elainellaceae cyanobacterium]
MGKKLDFVEVKLDGGSIDGLEGAYSISISSDGKHVYVAGDIDNKIAVFSRSLTDGTLTFIESLAHGTSANSQPQFGGDSVSISPDGTFVYATSFSGDTVTVFSRNAATGQLTQVQARGNSAEILNSLDGVSGIRVSPDGAFAYATSYFSDAIAIFDRDTTTGELAFLNQQKDNVGGVDGLDGASSITFSPDGKFVYVTSDNDNAIAVFSQNETTGLLTFIERQKDGLGGVDGLRDARSLSISPDGKFVYAVGEGDSAITVFSRNSNTGGLTFVETVKDGVNGVDGIDGVYNINISLDGRFVYAAGNNEDAIVMFSRNETTGTLTFVRVRKNNLEGVTGLDGVTNIQISPDGKFFYASGYNDDAISVFSTLNVNTLPTSANSSVTGFEDALYSFKASDFAFADADEGDAFQTLEITSLETAGSLFFDTNANNTEDPGEAVSLGQVIVSANLASLKFRPLANAFGSPYATFGFKVGDGVDFSIDTSVMTINILDQPEFPGGGGTGSGILQFGTAPDPINFKGGRRGERLKGTRAAERIRGTRANDRLIGKGGRDRLIARGGKDIGKGGGGNDLVKGGGSNDRLSGQRGNDKLVGGSGDDLLRGGSGNDRLKGGGGHDILVGQSGADTLIGGGGADLYVFKSVADATDTIIGFQVGQDLVDIRSIFAQSAFAASSRTDQFLQFVKIEQTGANTTISLDQDGIGSGTVFQPLAILTNIEAGTVQSTSFVVA